MNEYCLNAGSNLELAFFMSFFVLLGHLIIHYWLPRRPYIPKEYRTTNSNEANESISLFKQILNERKGSEKK